MVSRSSPALIAFVTFFSVFVRVDLPLDLNHFSRLGSVKVSHIDVVPSSSSTSVKALIAVAMISFICVAQIMKRHSLFGGLDNKDATKMADFDERKTQPKWRTFRQRNQNMKWVWRRKTQPKWRTFETKENQKCEIVLARERRNQNGGLSNKET